jgi:class 3 adenylate cyclase
MPSQIDPESDTVADNHGSNQSKIAFSESDNDRSEGFVSQAESKAAPNAPQPTLETAHVLFMDIVGYSTLLTDEQPARMLDLQEVVRASAEFQNAQRAGQLLRLPTGDGMALSFFGDLEAPLRCATDISRALRDRPSIKLRMGIHSGLVYRIADINENLNIAGGGINIAQRVMDCGDVGHILLSKRMADDLGQLSRWSNDLHDLGEVEVKHRQLIHLCNLYNDEIGNPELPVKLRLASKPRPNRRRLVLASALFLTLVLSILGSIWLLRSLAQTRSLTYSLTVQKMLDGRKVGGEYESTGHGSYGNGWRYRMNVNAQQPGYLYMFNEGTVNYNLLFPTEANNNHVTPQQSMQSAWYFFDENPGVERVWIVFSDRPLSDLDAIVRVVARDATQEKLPISDSAQIKTVRDLTAHSKPIQAVVDDSKQQSTVSGAGNVLVSLLELEHKSKP